MTKKAKTVDKELPVELTTEEKAERGLALARLIKKRIDLMEEKKQFHAYVREKLLTLDEKIADTQNVVRTGKEPRKFARIARVSTTSPVSVRMVLTLFAL